MNWNDVDYEFEKYVILYESKTICESFNWSLEFEKYVILYESKTISM